MTRVTTYCLAVALLAAAVAGRASPESVAEIRSLLVAGRGPEAEAAARSAVDQLEGTTDPALADALDLLVEVLLASDRAAAEEAVELADRAVGLRRSSGAAPAALSSSLVRLGETLTAANRLDAAAAALAEAEALVGADDPRGRARVLNRLGAVRRAQGEAVEARGLYAAALAELDRCGATWDPELEMCLRGLAGSSYTIADYPDAQRTYRRLLTGQAAALGDDAVEVAVTRRFLATTESALGDLDEAEAQYRQALATLETRVGPSHVDVAAAVNGLAVVARKRGDYLEARRQLERALSIMEQLYGPRHRQVAGVLNNLGNVLNDLGDLGAARQAHERALTIRERSPVPAPLEVAQSLSNLGALALDEGDADRSVLLLERALAIREGTLGSESRLVALTLLNLGDSLQDGGRLQRAREVLERAVAIFAREPDRASSNLAYARNNLGLVLLQQGEAEAAVDILDQAREQLEAARGHGHPDVGTAISNQAKATAFRGRLGAALGLALESVRVDRVHLRLTAAGLSERQALLYAADQQSALDLALSIAAEGPTDDPTLLAAVWDALIRSRGLVLEEMIARHRRLVTSAGETSPLVNALRAAAHRLSGLLVEREGPATSAEIGAAREELEQAERALAEASPPFARDQARAGLGFDDVVASLPPGSALVAYARFDRRLTQDPERRLEAPEPWYLALVRASTGRLTLEPIADGLTVERLAREWRAAAGRSNGGERAAEDAGERLRNLIWDPVAERVADADMVFVVPDGVLGLLNLAALPTGPGSFLVEQGPLLAMLGQERDLVPDPLEEPARACLLALGAPDFDVAPSGSPVGPSAAADPTPRPARSAPEDLAGVRFTPLPETASETAAVVDLWRRRDAGAEALLLTGGEASEAAFEALAPGFRVLHLATHGFFLDRDMTPPTGDGRGVGALVPATAAADHPATPDPLRLSGLALAGANRRDPSAVEDGVLTAEEIAVLDLSGVEWAVLSACESGVGEVSSREGVFGLQRAFRVAGARTVIMSLWAVDDDDAREWMTALYRARLVDRRSTAEAVRQASLFVLATRRQRGESVHPSSWAAFVAAGDWR